MAAAEATTSRGEPPSVDASGTPAIGRPRFAFLAAAVTGVLMVLSFPAFDLDLLIWVTLVPLFAAARGAGGRRGFFLGYVAGLVLEAGGFYWICYAMIEFTELRGALIVVPVLLFLVWLAYSALIWGVLGWSLGRCRSPVAIHLVVLLFVAVEEWFPRIFPWQIGGAVHARDWLRQSADLLGAAGLTYLILLVNAAIYLTVEWRRGRAPFPRVTVAASATLLVSSIIYGAVREAAIEEALESVEPVRAVLLQPHIDPREKRDIELYFDHLAWAARESRSGDPDLVVLPEGMDPIAFYVDEDEPLREHVLRDGRSVFDLVESPFIIGGGGVTRERRVRNTAAFVLPREGTEGKPRVSFYSKNKLLLFGERVPFEEYLPDWFRKRVFVGTMDPGRECPVFELPTPAGTRRFRILICYEAVLPEFALEASRGVDFLVNITEDLWYGDTSHVGQHASVLSMRAVESRTPLVRCANGGPSGVVDATGSFSGRTRPFTRAMTRVEVRPRRFFSFYAVAGRWFPLAALATVVVIILVRRRARSG